MPKIVVYFDFGRKTGYAGQARTKSNVIVDMKNRTFYIKLRFVVRGA